MKQIIESNVFEAALKTVDSLEAKGKKTFRHWNKKKYETSFTTRSFTRDSFFS